MIHSVIGLRMSWGYSNVWLWRSGIGWGGVRLGGLADRQAVSHLLTSATPCPVYKDTSLDWQGLPQSTVAICELQWWVLMPGSWRIKRSTHTWTHTHTYWHTHSLFKGDACWLWCQRELEPFNWSQSSQLFLVLARLFLDGCGKWSKKTWLSCCFLSLMTCLTSNIRCTAINKVVPDWKDVFMYDKKRWDSKPPKYLNLVVKRLDIKEREYLSLSPTSL